MTKLTFLALALAATTVACGGTPAGSPDAGGVPARDGGLDGGGVPSGKDAAGSRAASLRLTEVNPSSHTDLVELVAASGGTLDGVRLRELTNSSFAFDFPSGYTVADGDVILLHLAGTCSDAPSDRASCGSGAPFSATAWDLSAPGSLTYSGKVFELFAADGTPMDGVPFVESHGAEPTSFVAAVEQLQRDRVWPATPACVDDPQTGLAKDRYCRNISVLWDGLADDGSNSVQRIAGSAPLAVPGSAAAWSAALPSTWGTYR